jgi:hypothetical protein
MAVSEGCEIDWKKEKLYNNSDEQEWGTSRPRRTEGGEHEGVTHRDG